MSSDSSKSDRQAVLVLLFGAACISFAAVFVKLVGLSGMAPTMIGFWRVAIGAAILFMAAIATGQGLKLSRSLVGWLALAGFIFFLDLFFWHRSIMYCGAGMATILANTQIFATTIMSIFIFRERPSAKFFAAAITAMFGVVLLIGIGSGEVEFNARYLTGIGFGLATGIAYGSYLVVIKMVGQKSGRPGFLTLMAWTSLFTTLFMGSAGAVEQVPWLPTSIESWVYLFLLALIVQSLGWWAIAGALPKVQASQGSLIILLQPVLATVWGVVLFGEYLSLVQIAGAVITLSAVYYGSTLYKSRL